MKTRCTRATRVAFAAITLMLGTTTRADSGSPSDTEAVAGLIYCYARGTDAIGDATTQTNPRDAGLAIYRECFTPEAEFRAWFPQQPFDSQTFPDPSTTSVTVGPAAWADFVNGVFRGNGYDFTQHMISNVDVSVRGRTATLTAYLNATHVVSGTEVGGPSQCVAVANGTYSVTARKFGRRWKATGLDLTLITFNPVFGCAAP